MHQQGIHEVLLRGKGNIKHASIVTGEAFNNLGNAYFDLGEMRTAIGYHEQHLVIVREVGERIGEGNTLGNLGFAWQMLGLYLGCWVGVCRRSKKSFLPPKGRCGDFGEGYALPKPLPNYEKRL